MTRFNKITLSCVLASATLAGTVVAAEAEEAESWDTSLADGNVWLMDMGRPPLWMPPGREPQRAFRFSIDDWDSSDVIDITADNHNSPHLPNRPTKSGQSSRHQSTPPIPNQRCNSLTVGGVERNQQIMIF